MGIGPAFAVRQMLEKNSLSLDHIDLVEVNEAFAAQFLAVEKELGLDRAKTNTNGGAIGRDVCVCVYVCMCVCG